MRSKRPNPDKRFSLAIVPGENGLTYRLCRRDFQRRMHFTWKTFPCGTQDCEIASWLWKARRELHDKVDAVELEMLGVIS
ncbi:MAG TPA: hypothetical protein VJQ26_02595 [Ktedonobacteraceae bacterium]|nr:hypothetical protein [Ktedonobacteraceae bacterium]